MALRENMWRQSLKATFRGSMTRFEILNVSVD